MQEQPELLIKPGMGALHYWKNIWRYRELFFFLAWRDILVRYKQTVIGVAWSVEQPLMAMIVITVVFGALAHRQQELFTALLEVMGGGSRV